VVLAKDLPPPDAAGFVAMTMRMMEFVILGRFVPEHGFPEHKA